MVMRNIGSVSVSVSIVMRILLVVTNNYQIKIKSQLPDIVIQLYLYLITNTPNLTHTL